MPTSLKAIAVPDAEASLSEEPGAVISHAGIRAGEGRATALPTATAAHFFSEGNAARAQMEQIKQEKDTKQIMR